MDKHPTITNSMCMNEYHFILNFTLNSCSSMQKHALIDIGLVMKNGMLKLKTSTY